MPKFITVHQPKNVANVSIEFISCHSSLLENWIIRVIVASFTIKVMPRRWIGQNLKQLQKFGTITFITVRIWLE